MRRSTLTGVVSLAAMLLGSAAPTQAAGDTEWLVAPYLWYPDISLDQSSGGGGGGISASDLLSKTDAAGMIRVEVARNRWGLSVDYLYLSVADNRNVTIPLPPNPTLGVRADLDLTVFEFSGVYRPSGEETGINYLAGVRSISTDKVLLVTPPSGPTERFEGDESVTDFLLGARYLHRFNNRWDVSARGDYSFGDSEGTWNLIGSVGFRFNDLFAMNLGYRHASLEYESNADGVIETTTIELSGPLLGFVFRF